MELPTPTINPPSELLLERSVHLPNLNLFNSTTLRFLGPSSPGLVGLSLTLRSPFFTPRRHQHIPQSPISRPPRNQRVSQSPFGFLPHRPCLHQRGQLERLLSGIGESYLRTKLLGLANEPLKSGGRACVWMAKSVVRGRFLCGYMLTLTWVASLPYGIPMFIVLHMFP